MKKQSFFCDGKEMEMDFFGELNGYEAIKKIGENPDGVIIIRNEKPIPLDEEILDGDETHLIQVFSGG